jgi:transcriptional regulator with XRE-family HTH domain
MSEALTRPADGGIKQLMTDLPQQSIGPGLIRRVRHALGESREGLAQLLGTSACRVWRFETGVERLPREAVRALTLVLAANRLSSSHCPANCWEVKDCSESVRAECPSYKLNGGRLCWLLARDFCSVDPDPRNTDASHDCRECPVSQMVQGTDADNGAAHPRRRRSIRAAEPVGACCQEGRVLCGMPRPERAISSR